MENLEVVLNDLEKSGSNTEDLKKLGETLKNDLSKGKDIDTIMHELITNIRQETENFFRGTNQYDVNYMTGFTSGIYLPSFDGSGEIKLVLYGGDSSRENNSFKIDSKTMFDVASITKLFTLVLTFKLSEEGIINLNDKIADLNPDFKGLEDFTFTDLIRMHGDIYTDDKGCVLFWHYCGFAYISGDVSTGFLEEVYQYFLINDTERRFILITDSEFLDLFPRTGRCSRAPISERSISWTSFRERSEK